jgi:hypothetical protein
MKTDLKSIAPLTEERLTRALIARRGKPVELLVHYEWTRSTGCIRFQVLSIEELGLVPGPIDSAQA